MSKRRPLIQGLNENAKITKEEEKFVFGESRETEQTTESEVTKPEVHPAMTGRVPITIRVRPEIGSALKRASLQRQLDGVEPNSMQDIVDEALDRWLRSGNLL